MAAKARNLRAALRRKRPHYGFGHEPIPPKSGKPKNFVLAQFIMNTGRIPETKEDFDEIKRIRTEDAKEPGD